MMNIKDAGFYAKFLKERMSQIEDKIYNQNNYMKVTEMHLKNAAYNEAKDEEIVTTPEREFDGQVHDLVHLLKVMIEERLMLSVAIETSKKNLFIGYTENGKDLTVDTATEFAKMLRDLCEGDKATRYYGNRSLKFLLGLKSGEVAKVGTGYKMNAEQNQVPYRYDIKVKNEIDYDRKNIKDLNKKLLDKADQISVLIDQAKLKDAVDFSPKFDIRDTAEDIIEQYLSSRKVNKEA